MFVNIELTKPKNKMFPVFSWLIRLFQWTKYSHVRLHWKSKSGIDIIYEAAGGEVRLIGEYAQKDHKAEVIKRYKINVTTEEYRKNIRLFRYAGVNYGKMQIVGIGMTYLFGLRKNPFSQGRRSQVCSELVGVWMKEVKGWDLGIDLDIAGPKEIDEALQKLCKQYPNEIKLTLDVA